MPQPTSFLIINNATVNPVQLSLYLKEGEVEKMAPESVFSLIFCSSFHLFRQHERVQN